MAKPPRRPARPVTLDDILSSAFVPDASSLLDPTLRGHLAIEALLIELIQLRRNDDKIYRLSFPDKVDYLAEERLIHTGLQEALIDFNDWRNDFAHVFGHEVQFTDVHALARQIESRGVDFSDSVGLQPPDQAAENYGGEAGVLAEILWCIAYELSFALMEAGGRDLFSADVAS